jgi:hypothetical protein
LASSVPTISDHPNCIATRIAYYKNTHKRVLFRPLTKSMALVNCMDPRMFSVKIRSAILADNYFYEQKPSCLFRWKGIGHMSKNKTSIVFMKLIY